MRFLEGFDDDIKQGLRGQIKTLWTSSLHGN